jgi:Spy/CpxP family protein refolding chaperone
MKKYLVIAILITIGHTGIAQVKRTTIKPTTDTATVKQSEEANKDFRKEILRQLNLTREQQLKMREINQIMKASREELEKNTTLPDAEKKTKLRSLRKDHAQKIQAVLTEEQKVMFRQLKAKNNSENPAQDN